MAAGLSYCAWSLTGRAYGACYKYITADESQNTFNARITQPRYSCTYVFRNKTLSIKVSTRFSCGSMYHIIGPGEKGQIQQEQKKGVLVPSLRNKPVAVVVHALRLDFGGEGVRRDGGGVWQESRGAGGARYVLASRACAQDADPYLCHVQDVEAAFSEDLGASRGI